MSLFNDPFVDGLKEAFPDTTEFAVLRKRDWEIIKNWILSRNGTVPEELSGIKIQSFELEL